MIYYTLHDMCYILKSRRTERQLDLTRRHAGSLLCLFLFKSTVHDVQVFFPSFLVVSVCAQQIDDMLAGSLTQEDEEAVLAELEAITQVCA